MKRVPLEEKMIPISATLALKHLAELERLAKQHNCTVSTFVRALIQERFAQDESSFMVIKEISPELRQTLQARADKMGKEINEAARTMLASYCHAAEVIEG